MLRLKPLQSLSDFILTRGACVGGGAVNLITLLGRVRGSRLGQRCLLKLDSRWLLPGLYPLVRL